VNPINALSVAIAVSLMLSTFIIAVMVRPLRGVLNDLCPARFGASFWVSFTIVMLYVTPMFFTLLFMGTILVPDFVTIVRTALAASLFGAFSALLVVGYQISQARPASR
jgi:hypothetical protein